MGLLKHIFDLFKNNEPLATGNTLPSDSHLGEKKNEIQKPEINKSQNNKLNKNTKRNISINLGIDFGTSYSKVCFAERKNFYFVDFSGSKFKPSVVYYDYKNKMFYYDKPNTLDTIERIKYFKYSIIDDSLPRSKNLGMLFHDIIPEILCCLFFLACLIKRAKEYAQIYFQDIAIINEWSITMGVPLDNNDPSSEHRRLYDYLLHIANKLSSILTDHAMSVDDVYQFYLENKNMIIPKFQYSPINTLPELYAESLILLQNRDLDNGVYALVDIGGGTIDLAILFKEGEKLYSIPSKNIKPLGIEIIVNNIASDKSLIQQIRNDLKEKHTVSNIEYILPKEEDKYKELFKVAFASTVVDFRTKDVQSEDIKHAIYLNNRTLNIYICGGGANYKWYKDGILQTKEQLWKLLKDGLRLKINSIKELLPKSVDNHRLLIAYSLAQRIEEIPIIKGYPWSYIESGYFTENTDRSSILDEIHKEKYGKYL